MKISRYSVVALVVSVVAMLAVACGGASSSSRRLADSADSLSYVIGMNIAYNIMQMDSTLRPEMVMAGVEDAMLEKLNQKVWRIEGQQNAFWIAMDYLDVVVHIFQTELREFYKLEDLWADAPMKRYDYEL